MTTSGDQSINQNVDWVIETQDLAKVYQMGSTEVHALLGVSLKVERGELLALMGTSGCGKSTLMHMLGCLDTPSSGNYYLEGQNVGSLSGNERARIRNTKIGFVFQTFNLLTGYSALENVALPLLYWGRSKNVRERAMEALDQVGLANRAHHRPTELSGGQRQRVAIARALANNPSIILADEPTGNLDSATGSNIMQLLCELWGDKRTIILVTHDVNIAEYAQRTLHMQDGLILNGQENHVTG